MNHPIIQGLRSTGEAIRRWSVHCEECFSFKNPAPSRDQFIKHYHQDPFSARSDFIRVVIEDQQIVATARLCLRPLNLRGGRGLETAHEDEDDNMTWAAGIAEVCVPSSHQGRGLARAVVKEALQYIRKTRLDIKLSFLHCAPSLIPVYASMGYLSIPTTWRLLPYSPSKLVNAISKDEEDSNSIIIKPYTTDQDKIGDLITKLAPLHCTGTVLRPKAYWESWITSELATSSSVIWALSLAKEEEKDEWQAYAVFRPTRTAAVLGLIDFGCSTKSLVALQERLKEGKGQGGGRGIEALIQLFATYYLSSREEVKETATAALEQQPSSIKSIRIPAALLVDEGEEEGAASGSRGEGEEIEVDPGWVYKSLIEEEEESDEVMEGMQSSLSQYFIWPIDHF